MNVVRAVSNKGNEIAIIIIFVLITSSSSPIHFRALINATVIIVVYIVVWEGGVFFVVAVELKADN